MEMHTIRGWVDLAGFCNRFHTWIMVDSKSLLPGIWCIIPAAGASSRMGSWKPMLPWGSKTICETVVDTVLSAGFSPVLVSGYRSSELASVFSGRTEVLVVENRGWKSGMLGSIQEGIRAVLGVDPACDGVFITLSDMPRVPVKAFLLVQNEVARMGMTGRYPVVFAGKNGKPGHPVWIPGHALPGVLAVDPGSRLRDHLLELPWVMVEVDDDGIHADIDTPEDYAACKRSS